MARLRPPINNSVVGTTVAIVEDHADLSRSWAELIEDTPGYRCVCVCDSAERALREIPHHNPDVVLMDINLPGRSGIECTEQLKSKLPGVQVLVLTVYEETDRIFRALKAGASGYLLKRTSPEQLMDAIRDVKQGGAPMTPEVARKVVQSFRKPAHETVVEAELTSREEQILRLLAEGFVTKEIADKLGISFFTAQNHLKRIYEKLHVHSRTEAVIKYLGEQPA
jgi:DNA-binding NarL/FixJ family response regulator